MSKNNKANVDDIFGASPSGSTKRLNGTKKDTGGPKKSSTGESGSSTEAKSKSAKQKKGQSDGWERWLEAELEEPMTMSLHEAAMKAEELSTISWANQTKLQRVEFSTAMRILREAREKKRAEERAANFVPNEGAKGKVAALGTAGRSSASEPSPTAKLGGATRIGKPALDEEAPNRKIDYLAEVEATGRSMAAMAIDSKFTQTDKEILAILRNHRLRGISPNKRTPAQEEEITLAVSLINEGRERVGVGPLIVNPGKLLLPSTAKGLQEAPPVKKKKAEFDFDSLIDVDDLFADDEEEGQKLPPNLRETPTWKVNPVMVILHEAFGPEPEGYEAWRTKHLKMDGIAENKDKRAWREANKDFDPFKPEAFAARYNFERKIIGDREKKGADLSHPATKAELIEIGKAIAERIGKGPLTGADAIGKGDAPPVKKQKARSASGQGEKAAAAIAVAGQEEEVANFAPKFSDELSQDAWDLAMDEALSSPESQAQEIDYSPTYRAMLAEMRWALTSSNAPNVTDVREELLWRYVLHNDMSETSIKRRAEITERVMKYYNKHVLNEDGTPKTGLVLNAKHYRVIMAAKMLAGLMEDYATLPLKKGQSQATDESITNLCKQATVRYIEAHKDAGYPTEPSYLQYRAILAKIGKKEGYILNPEDLAAA